MSGGVYELRAYTERFRAQVVELQTHHWGPHRERNDAYLQWKYYENPYIEEPCITLALRRGRVVGMRGMYGARWQFGLQESFDVPCAGDVVIHPEHRNRGLFEAMMTHAEGQLVRRGYANALNLSASAVTYVLCLQLGWKGIGPLEILARDADGWIRRLWSSRQAPSGDSPRPQAMSDLVRSTCRDGRLRHVRDPAYLAWRFRNPLSRYRFLFEPEEAGSDLAGFLVLSHALGRPDQRFILDWEARDDGTRERLLTRAIRDHSRSSLQIWSASASRAARKQLYRRRFWDAREPGFLGSSRPTVLIRKLEGTPDVPLLPLDRAQWDMRMVFSDAF